MREHNDGQDSASNDARSVGNDAANDVRLRNVDHRTTGRIMDHAGSSDRRRARIVCLALVLLAASFGVVAQTFDYDNQGRWIRLRDDRTGEVLIEQTYAWGVGNTTPIAYWLPHGLDRVPMQYIDQALREQAMVVAALIPRDRELTQAEANDILNRMANDFVPRPPCDDSQSASVLVEHYYNSILGRASEPGGNDYWTWVSVTNCAAGEHAEEAFSAIVTAFYHSPEYLNRNRTNADFVGDVYGSLLYRQPEPGGLDYWTWQLDIGAQTRDQVMLAVLSSPESVGYMNDAFGGGTSSRVAALSAPAKWTHEVCNKQCEDVFWKYGPSACGVAALIPKPNNAFFTGACTVATIAGGALCKSRCPPEQPDNSTYSTIWCDDEVENYNFLREKSGRHCGVGPVALLTARCNDFYQIPIHLPARWSDDGYVAVANCESVTNPGELTVPPFVASLWGTCGPQTARAGSFFTVHGVGNPTAWCAGG